MISHVPIEYQGKNLEVVIEHEPSEPDVGFQGYDDLIDIEEDGESVIKRYHWTERKVIHERAMELKV